MYNRYTLVPNLNFSTSSAIFLNFFDSTGPVFFTILWNTDCCFCRRLNGVSNSITLPEDKTYKSTTSTTQLFTIILTHQYSIRVHYCFQSVSNSKDSTMVELLADHLLNYTIRSALNTCHHHTALTSHNILLTHIRSTFAVASSITRILFLLNSALARHINCRWPTLKLEPPSDTSDSNPLSKLLITSFSCTWM